MKIDTFKISLLADSAYLLSDYILTPYRDNGHLNNIQRFNTKHSKTRVVIERAFGTLNGRFRKLKYIYMYNTLDMIPLVIITCCILRNICIENEDELMDEDVNDAIEIQNDVFRNLEI